MGTEALVLAGVVGVVAVMVLVAYGIVSLVLPKPAADPDRFTLVEAAAALRPARGSLEGADRAFTRAVRGSMLGVSPERAVELMLLAGGLAALGAFLGFGRWEFAVLAFAAGVGATAMLFAALRSRARHAIQDQLPDGLFQLSRSLRSGQALVQAFRTAAEYTPAPLAEVFSKVAGRMDMGMSAEAALAIAAEDVQLTDFDAVVSVVGLNSRAGGRLPQLLDRLAAAIRDRNQFRGYARAVTALSTITTVFVAIAAPVAALAYVIFAPELFWNFFDTGLGLGLFAVAAGLELVGVVWMLLLLARQRDAY